MTETPAKMRTRAKAGSISQDELQPYHALVAGVVAAPPSTDRKAWLNLLPKGTPRRIKNALVDLESGMRSNGSATGGDTISIAQRVALLREQLEKQQLDGFIIPHDDQFGCEFTPARDQRLAFMTGFTGSAGCAIVLKDKAVVLSDDRYKVRLPNETDTSVFEVKITQVIVRDAAVWVKEHLPEGGRLGYDPWLHQPGYIASMKAAVEAKGGKLIAPAGGNGQVENPIDVVWGQHGQPAAPISAIVPHPRKYSGEPAEQKVKKLSEGLKESGVDALVLTSPSSIAWLLNIRGGDVEGTPLPLSYAVIGSDGSVTLFRDQRKLSAAVKRYFWKLKLPMGNHPFEEFAGWLSKSVYGIKVQVDPKTAPCAVFDLLTAGGAQILEAPDPCELPKACKNRIELRGAREAHRRDGAVLTTFIRWVKLRAPEGGAITELQLARVLDDWRRKAALNRGLSFPTISAAGENAADVHYAVTEKSDREIRRGDLYLVDSGGQYLDGTTDVTRTLAIGEITAEKKRNYTLVLKGHIAVDSQIFPAKLTSGARLDTLARQFLWRYGLDFGHGVGHGVGSYLDVHEGPQRISYRVADAILMPGMILSNEPGYYDEVGGYGIRLENLEEVVRVQVPGSKKEMLGLRPLTLAPFDLDAIDWTLMTPEEIDWLDRYHARVRDDLGPLLDEETREWLLRATTRP